MAYDIGPRIGIEGEREYKQALDEISRGQKVLASELGLVSEKFNGQENTLEALTAKHDVLQRTLFGEREKVETLRKAVAESAKNYGEADKRTEEWQIKLNKAEAQLVKTERATKEAEDAIEKLSESEKTGSEVASEYGEKIEDTNGRMSGLGDMLDGIAGKFGIALPDGVKGAINSFASFDASSIAVVGSIGAIATALVKVEKQLIATTQKSASYVDNINTLSATTGISTEALQEYTYAAELLDVSVETITSSQTKLIRSMDSARDGSKDQAEAFEKLNVRITDSNGNLRDSEEVYWEVIDALGRMKNDTERDSAAMDILGKSARDLNPLIKAGSDQMNKLAKEAHDTGYVLDEETLKSLNDVDDAMQRLTNSTDTAKNKVSAEFAPYLTESIDKITTLIKDGGKVLAESGIVDAFGMLLESVTDILVPVDDLTDDKLPALERALRPVAKVIAGIGDTMEFIAALLKLDFRQALQSSGFGYWFGLGTNNMLQLELEWQAKDTNARTNAVGYGEYYFNGLYYGNKEGAAAAGYTEYYGNWIKNHAKGDIQLTFDEWKSKNGFNSSGNVNFEGGFTWVGENGPERVFLPEGTRIDNAQESRESGDTIIYMTIDAKSVKEFNDIIRFAEIARMENRKKRG